jgi:hypothetical protein
MSATPERLARIRAAISAGSYAPDVDDVTDSLLGWLVRPEQFDRAVAADRFESPGTTAEGPLDRWAAHGDTADDAETRR